jgi:hypothetical protein
VQNLQFHGKDESARWNLFKLFRVEGRRQPGVEFGVRTEWVMKSF